VDKPLGFTEDVLCGTCHAPGRLLMYRVGGEGYRQDYRLEAEFSCSCPQRWLEEGRSPFLGFSKLDDKVSAKYQAIAQHDTPTGAN
jgi:hypothetical protein